jgi:starch-binding outer membrane protein, SusD/RagB family
VPIAVKQKKSDMKRLVILYAAAVSLSLGACKKALEVDPQQTIKAEDAIKTEQDVRGLVIGCYSIMGGGALYGTNLIMLPDLQASDGYCSWRGTFQSFRQVATKTMIRDNTEANRTWTAAYRAINNANLVIENLDKVSDPDTRNLYEGEALFVRGILHFELARMYGGAYDPLTANTQLGAVNKITSTKNETEASTAVPRNTVAQNYTQVIADLTAAVGKLPEENGTRANKLTALAFLARVYLQQSNFVAARNAANLVINSGYYELNPVPTAVYTNRNTKESIWEIQQNDQNNAGNSNDGLATFFASLPGIGRGDVRVTATFVSNFYEATDSRRGGWFYIGTGARPGNTYCGKWTAFEQNLPVVRISEMYLIRAECNQRLGTNVGDTPENDVDVVRDRSGASFIAAPTLTDILNERRRELAFEGIRIHDIKRLKTATGTFQWNDNRLVFPIPQREVDATNGVLVQNPGY